MPSRTTRRRREEFSVRRSDSDLIRVTFDRENNHIVQFSVQYLALIQDKWHPIVRIDTAHGRAHMDISHPNGSQETRELRTQNYDEALTWAIEEIQKRWEFYRERYERGMQ